MTQPPAAGDHWVVEFHFVGDSDPMDVSEAQRLRLFCHYLLTHMPDQALREAVGELAEMYGFYRRLPAPPTPALPVKRVPATAGQTAVRPVFPATEE
jgi:hypothetical protein